MGKNVYRSQEIVNLGKKAVIQSPFEEEPVTVEIESIEEYTGPTADDLRIEAEAFKANWEKEKGAIIAEARAEADRIIQEAEQTAFDEVKKKTDQAQKIKQEAEDESKKIMGDIRNQAEQEKKEAEENTEIIKKDAYKEGFSKGNEDGYEEGKAETERLIEQLHTIISKAIEKRNEIINETETQIINLVLLISKKVVKVISENQKNVVINNVIQALRKMKSRGEVEIKVNLTDVQLTSDHIKDFMRMVESVSSITVLEDSTVDKGGCVIETDFGQIDARISSQFAEIEKKILELAPIKPKGEE